MGVNKEKEQAIELAMTQIEREYGAGAVMRWGNDKVVDVDVIPTGSLALDLALGVGGVPRGRVIEIYGPEGSGKTTLAYHIIAEAQKLGGVGVFIDTEHAMDARYAKRIGIDMDNLLISQPDTGEQALEIAETLVRSGAVDIVVVDSVAALVPRAEIEGQMGDSHMGLQARLMSQALRKLCSIVRKSNTCLIFTNQIRHKIIPFGNPETTTGGLALKFYATIRMEIRRSTAIKDKEISLGVLTKVKVVKNKVASPFKEAEFDIVYGEGISKEGNLLDVGVAQEIVEKSGSWYSYAGERLGQGRENVKAFMKENPDFAQRLESEIRNAIGLEPIEPAPQASDESVDIEEDVISQTPDEVEADMTLDEPEFTEDEESQMEEEQFAGAPSISE